MPSSKATSKRKATEPVAQEDASDDESAKAARRELLSDSDDGAPAPAHEPSGMSPEDMAKSMFMSSAAVPCPEAKHSSGGGGSVNIEGIVVRASKISVQGKSGMVPKMQITVFATKITAPGTSPVITTGCDGISFALPTKQLAASPDDIAKDANAKGPTVIDIEDASTKTGYLGMFSTGFYVESKADKSSKSDVPSAEACTPGTRVLVSNVTCTFGKADRDRAAPIYVNAKKIQPISAPVAPGAVPASLINEMCTANAQNTALMLLSTTMHGFFGINYPEAVHAEQADEIKMKWDTIVSNAVSKCENLAAINKSTNEDVASALSAYAERIRSIKGEDAAQGMQLFNNDLPKDCTTQYVAPIVVHGVKPGATTGHFCNMLFDASKRESLPPSFCEGLVAAVNFKGNLINVDYRLFMVPNRDKAIDAIKQGKNPVLHTANAAASVKLSKRSVGPEMVGSLVNAKVEMAINEVMFVMDHVPFAAVFPRAANDLSIEGHFTNVAGYNFKDGIMKVGVHVSQQYVDTNMMGGRGVLIHKHPDGIELVEPLAGAGTAPVLSKNYYQAVSEGSFDFDSLTAPDGMEIKYYVLYSGCGTNVKTSPVIATSVDEGERHLGDIIPSVRDDGDVKTFLREDAVVYAVAV
jgi:hypothetical protein